MPLWCRSVTVLSSIIYGLLCLGQVPAGMSQQPENTKKYTLSGTVTNGTAPLS